MVLYFEENLLTPQHTSGSVPPSFGQNCQEGLKGEKKGPRGHFSLSATLRWDKTEDVAVVPAAPNFPCRELSSLKLSEESIPMGKARLRVPMAFQKLLLLKRKSAACD